ncbi:unnamed protein product [Arctia plantaginis]|uniref:Uncharacterized protein n=1 Tax=Arctia plantaginis TaxID=874455 RepID=A0A8S0ZD25_ARCPL|nr:unnamed protein product [Arctia plantaginis]
MAAKRTTKKAVARARSDHLQPLYEKLESSERQKLIYKLARSRIEVAQDISKAAVRKILGATSYFNELLNKQRKEVQPPDLPPNQGLVPPVTTNR